jgi:hypothetical protein
MESRGHPWGWQWWLLASVGLVVGVIALYRTFCPPGQICRCNYIRMHVGMTGDDVSG